MISAKRFDYDAETRRLVDYTVRVVRPAVALPGDALSGRRFNDNAYVIAVLESMSPQLEFLTYPFGSVEKALIEAGRSDYWYEKEKEYFDYTNEYEMEDTTYES